MTLLPRCPYCGQDPAHLAGLVTHLGGITAVVVFCEDASCRKIHGVFPVPVPTVVGPPRPDLWMPGVR